jgi:hypothetical protein
MAPSIADLYPIHITDLKARAAEIVTQSAVPRTKSLIKEPLKLSGVLDQFNSVDLTPAIGREFPDAKLIDWLNAPNADELIRDLAIMGEILPNFLFPLTWTGPAAVVRYGGPLGKNRITRG